MVNVECASVVEMLDRRLANEAVMFQMAASAAFNGGRSAQRFTAQIKRLSPED